MQRKTAYRKCHITKKMQRTQKAAPLILALAFFAKRSFIFWGCSVIPTNGEKLRFFLVDRKIITKV